MFNSGKDFKYHSPYIVKEINITIWIPHSVNNKNSSLNIANKSLEILIVSKIYLHQVIYYAAPHSGESQLKISKLKFWKWFTIFFGFIPPIVYILLQA